MMPRQEVILAARSRPELLAALPAATPAARSVGSASPTYVRTACAAAWQSAASDGQSHSPARAVAPVAPGPALSMPPRGEGSDPEASRLTCAEYRINLRATILSAQKTS